MVTDGPGSARSRIVFLYGPPASGKLAVGRALAELTGFKLFHNHLTVNAVRELFEFRSAEYLRALFSVRLELLKRAAESGIDVVTTAGIAHKRSAPRPTPSDAFVEELRIAVSRTGGRVLFVQLRPRVEVLEARVADPSRATHGKITTVDRLRRDLADRDYDQIHASDAVIDNSDLLPSEVAKQITELYGLDRVSLDGVGEG